MSYKKKPLTSSLLSDDMSVIWIHYNKPIIRIYFRNIYNYDNDNDDWYIYIIDHTNEKIYIFEILKN